MHLTHPFCHGVSRGAPTRHQRFAARVALGPERQPAVPQEVLIVEAQFFEAGARATLVSFSSNFFEVPLALLPSAIFCTPERAACTIWSWVRLLGLM